MLRTGLEAIMPEPGSLYVYVYVYVFTLAVVVGPSVCTRVMPKTL